MNKDQVKEGSVYAVKVSGAVVPVRIDNAYERLGRFNSFKRTHATAMGWKGTNLLTGREVRIRSAAKLRHELEKDTTSQRWVLKRSEERKVALALVKCMNNANGCRFKTTKEDWQELDAAVARMLKAGFQATEDNVKLIADGDEDEREEAFKAIDGFNETNVIMGRIFQRGAQ